MAKTRQQIIEQALFEIQAVDGGDSPSAEDANVFDLNAVAEYVAGKRIVDLTTYVSTDELPDAYFFPFALMAAAKYARGFGLSQDQQDALEARAIADLRVITDRVRPVRRMQFERMTY